MDLVELASELCGPDRIRPLPTVERLREVIIYEPVTGKFQWKVARRGLCITNMPGRINRGYRLICIDGASLLAHRIAWAMHYGQWPAAQLDHRDRDRLNNAIANLREATSSQNQANRKGKGLLLKGVTITRAKRRKYQAQIKVHQEQIYLGCYETELEAHEAYCTAAHLYFGDFARVA